MNNLIKKVFHKNDERKEKLVEKLLEEKRITTSEAVILLGNSNTTIHVAELNISSGARIIGGDNNSQEHEHRRL